MLQDPRFLDVPSPSPSPSPSTGRRRGPRPPPSYRHGTPSGPWPWVDIEDQVDKDRIEDPDNHLPMSGAPCPHVVLKGQEFCWCKYPQSMFPNWTQKQQSRSGIRQKIKSATSSTKRHRCFVYYVDVKNDGRFVNAGPARKVEDETLGTQWKLMMTERPQGSKARVVFIDDLTGPIMQMMGTRYNIEPFFFSSTLKGIPSRFQSNVEPNIGDHITITLSFIRAHNEVPEVETPDFPSPDGSVYTTATQATTRNRGPEPRLQGEELVIDTQKPLPLRSPGSVDQLLKADFVSLHMVRSLRSSTVISCHDKRETTKAETMHERFLLTGKSVYWSSIFEKTQDATFLLLSILWYVMYAWDEVFEALYKHICFLETEVMEADGLGLTQELHMIRAHLMHYESLLQDLQKTVEFVRNTPNPGLGNPDEPQEVRGTTRVLINRECHNMMRDIVRLERSRVMQDKRLKNVMDLGFSLVNIEDSRRMQRLTEAAVKDSAAMKQIAYLTMVFLPSTFVAGVFGMNIVEINPEGSASNMTLAKYFAVALPLTFVTIWIVIAYQIQIEDPRMSKVDKVGALPGNAMSNVHGPVGGHGHIPKEATWKSEVAAKARAPRYRRLGAFSRLLWPFFLTMSMLERRKLVESRAKHRQATAAARCKYP
ncbi:hypothetical protein DFP72DRAFT_903974 [Ephemerocybe angulata]|uniref:Uncharacterized protein n=1 Tax=Ephemerocybe angulata TaxID=980116 RepID=A0A8H6HU71_9AGAR|nr:hypothetical protein DFP72DRAFT_903974 [Tulosesus angulatus]